MSFSALKPSVQVDHRNDLDGGNIYIDLREVKT